MKRPLEERKRILLRLLLTVSAISIQFLQFQVSIENVILRFFDLALLLILLWRIPNRKQPVVFWLFGLLMSIPIVIYFVGRFQEYWIYSAIPEKLAGLFHMSTAGFLMCLGTAFSTVALFSISFVFARMIEILNKSIYCSFKPLCCLLRERFRPSLMIRMFTFAFSRVLFCAIAGIAALTLISSISSPSMEKHMVSSAAEIEKGVIQFPVFSWSLDDFTDSIMLLSASEESEKPILERALLNYRGAHNDDDPLTVLKEHYLRGVPFNRFAMYGRYWHGYKITLRPLLALTDYHGIRTLNTAVQFGIIILACFLLRHHAKALLLPFLATCLMLRPIETGLSLQYSSCFYVMMAGVLCLLIKRSNCNRYYANLFLYLGIATSFLDLLTWPIVTFGIPGVVLLFVCHTECEEEKLLMLIKAGLLWCMGYSGMWVSKWILGSLLTDVNIMANALPEIISRTGNIGTSGETISFLACLGRNISGFCFDPAFLLILFLIYRYLYHSKIYEASYIHIFPNILLSLLPLCWYAFAMNHSYVHSFYTCRDLSVSVFAVLSILRSLQSDAYTEERSNQKEIIRSDNI